MKWNNALRDKLPKNGQEVLICVEGVYYVARFDSNAKSFRLVGDPSTSFEISSMHTIYWIEITGPSRIARDEY